MKMPGENRPAGALLRLDELERLLRKGRGARLGLAGLLLVAWPSVAFGVWVLGPLTPAAEWYPVPFVGLLATLVPLSTLTGKLFNVLVGAEVLPTDDERKRRLLEQVRVAKYPVDVCTDCQEMFDVSFGGECPTCRKKFTVMRVLGEREVRRLDALLLGPPGDGAP